MGEEEAESDSEDDAQDLAPLPCYLYPDTPMNDRCTSRDDAMMPCEAPAMAFALPCKQPPMKLPAAVPVSNPVPLWQALYTPQSFATSQVSDPSVVPDLKILHGHMMQTTQCGLELEPFFEAASFCSSDVCSLPRRGERRRTEVK